MFHHRGGFHRRRHAFAWQGAHEPGAEGWHGHQEHSPFDWIFHRMARRFPFGPGRGGEAPFFGRGDLKYGLLELLLERPKHGYEMIKELEDKAGGFYTPSAGAVYPALQMMEDRDWVTSQTIDGKKVYSITDAGKQALKEHQQDKEHLGKEWGFGRGFGGGKGFWGRGARPEIRELHRQAMDTIRLLWSAVMASEGDPEKLAQLAKILKGTQQQLQQFMKSGKATDKDGNQIF